MKRTHNNNQLQLQDINNQVELIGWVSKRRNLGSIVFIDLRDRYGITQLFFDETMAAKIKDVRNEYILHVQGIVKERQDKNPHLATGNIEVVVTKVNIVNEAKTTPLIIADETDALEDVRLQYRYLDLRRPLMQEKLRIRHAISKSIRNTLDTNDFIEIETPLLAKSTPEGARDYLVPSRVHPGNFYALPQSPQLFKQLLMISGFERYYQFARCFRDEDLRADRQTDFTQIDIEVSFMEANEIQIFMEKMLVGMMKEVKGVDIPTPFKRYTYEEAMNRFGSDKPNDQFAMELIDLTTLFIHSECKVFSTCISQEGSIKALIIPNKGDLSRKEIDKTTDLAKKYKAKGLVTMKFQNNTLESSINKFLKPEEISNIIKKCQLKENDLVLIISDTWKTTCSVLGALRMHFAKELKLLKTDTFNFSWVYDFPMFEYDDEEQRYYAMHHPFTRPRDEDLKYVNIDPNKVKAQAYDLVLNGYEIGGGSLRIFDRELQSQIFKVLGFNDAQIKERFGFFVDAFQYGTPPHGGIAFGFDRLAMILSESESIRDVIAFPKNANAKCMMSDTPCFVDQSQIDELSLQIKNNK